MLILAREMNEHITHNVLPTLKYDGWEQVDFTYIFFDSCDRVWEVKAGYEQETINERGDYWVAPSQEVKDEITTVYYVTDPYGKLRRDMAEKLEELLN